MGDGWNFADVWEIVAERLPDAPCQIQGERVVSWGDANRRADGVAAWLVDLGIEKQDKVAHYLYNCPEYLESMFGMFKVGAVPVNTNYRYADEELLYLWDNADAVAVVFHGTFAARIEALRPKLPRIKGWLWVDDASGPCPEWATRYEDAAASGLGGGVRAPWGRSGDDVYMLYTGGTTGMPKGVMWRQDDIFAVLNGTSLGVRYTEPDLDLAREAIVRPGPKVLPACPLMHGTGCFTQLIILSGGGCSITLESRNLDIDELLATIEREA
ncbi:MAG TPA: AMP-binding protein, partial [Acidimicrobiales bacterium]